MFAEIASLAGDPSRAAMLHALMDGRALSAAELAEVAGITPATASEHLARMTEAGLLSAEKQGRRKYCRLASVDVAQMMESIMRIALTAAPAGKPVRTGPRENALRMARTCYDHLAGRLGVAIANSLVAGGYAEIEPDAGAMTEKGVEFLDRLGVTLRAASSQALPTYPVSSLPRLERTASPSGGTRRSGIVHPLLRSRLGSSHGWNPRRRHHAERANGAAGFRLG